MSKISDDEFCPCGSGRLYKDCHIRFRLSIASPPTKQKIACLVVPEPAPDTRTVFKKLTENDGTVFFAGMSDEASFHCGQCGVPLATGVAKDSIENIVLQCNICKSLNSVPDSKDDNNANNEQSLSRIRRNQLCPCGSGKKYKHCHGDIRRTA